MALEDELVELYRKASCELPDDVLNSLNTHTGDKTIDTILENVKLAKQEGKPMCQDTGTPIWYVRVPSSAELGELKKVIESATKRATEEVPLRHNSLCPVTGRDFGNVPIIHFKPWDKDFVRFDLLLKGGGSENCGAWYKLPDAGLNAERDLDGAKKCVVDAVKKAGANGCPPYFLGVCIGGPGDEVAHYSKKMLLREVDDINKNEKACKLEEEILRELNELDIGPMGLGGKPSVLGVKVGVLERHPASYFVAIAFSCWALRRGRLDWL